MSSRFKLADLSDRQKKSFMAMYQNSEYTTKDIATRFGMSQGMVTEIAKGMGLKIRQPGTGKVYNDGQ